MAMCAAPFLLIFPGCEFCAPGGCNPSPTFDAGAPPLTSAIFCSIETYSRPATEADEAAGIDMGQPFEQGFWKPRSNEIGLSTDADGGRTARFFMDPFPDGSAVCVNPATIPGTYTTANGACQQWCASQGWRDEDGHYYQCSHIAWQAPGVPADGSLPDVCDEAGTMLPGKDPRKFWKALVGAARLSGNDLTKTAADGWGNSGAVSTSVVGRVQITASETTTYRIFGLGDGINSHDNIEWGLLLDPSGILAVKEGAATQVSVGNYATENVLEVGVEGGRIVYKRDGTVLHTSDTLPTYPLHVEASLYSQGATLKGIRTSF